MTQYLRPAQAFAATGTSTAGRVVSDETQDLAAMMKRFQAAVTAKRGTGYFGTVKSRNTTERWENLRDDDYTALVNAGVDFSDFRGNSNTAPTTPSQANSTALPSMMHQMLHSTVILRIGDSLTNSQFGAGTYTDFNVVANRMWTAGVSNQSFTGSTPQYFTASGANSPDWCYHSRWAHERSRIAFNCGRDSWRIKSQSGYTYAVGNDWTNNVDMLGLVPIHSSQLLAILIYLGTNDVKHGDDSSNPGVNAVPAGTPGYTYAGAINLYDDAKALIAAVKAKYSGHANKKIIFKTPAARVNGGTFNAKFVEFANYAVANKADFGADIIINTNLITEFSPTTPTVVTNSTNYQPDETHFTPAGTAIHMAYDKAAIEQAEGFTPDPAYAGALA